MSIQQILADLGYQQPDFQGINYSWYKEAGFEECLNIDCTYDSFDWCLDDKNELYGYKDLPTVLGRINEVVPEHGRGLNTPGSNEIIMMHNWIPTESFKAIIEKIQTKNIEFISIQTQSH